MFGHARQDTPLSLTGYFFVLTLWHGLQFWHIFYYLFDKQIRKHYNPFNFKAGDMHDREARMSKRKPKSRATPKWHNSPSARRAFDKKRRKRGWQDPREKRPKIPDWLGIPISDEDYGENIRPVDAEEDIPREEY